MRMDNEDLEKILVETPHHWMWESEMLWARRVAENQFEIRSIPYAAYGLNRGDIVQTEKTDKDRSPRVRRVLQNSGHRTIRVIFTNPKMPVPERENLFIELKQYGTDFEKVNDNYFIMDVADPEYYEQLCSIFGRLHAGQVVAYETCEGRVTGSFGDDPANDPRQGNTPPGIDLSQFGKEPGKNGV